MANLADSQKSLIEVVSSAGESMSCEANSPVALQDNTCFWYVESGHVDLFLIESKDDIQSVAPQHLMRVESGRLIPYVTTDHSTGNGHGTKLELIAKGRPGTRLSRIPIVDLDQIQSSELAEQIDLWITAITKVLARYVIRSPRPEALLTPTQKLVLSKEIVSVSRSVVWACGVTHGTGLFMDVVDPAEVFDERTEKKELKTRPGTAPTTIPLTRESWISIFEDVTISGLSTESVVQDGSLLEVLESFHRIALYLERLNRQLTVIDDANLEHDRVMNRRVAEDTARSTLLEIFPQRGERQDTRTDTMLGRALRLVGHRTGIDFNIPQSSKHSEEPASFFDILELSNVRARRVKLNNEEEWWRKESTTLLAYRATDNKPLVLTPGLNGRFVQIDPETNKRLVVTSARAKELKEEAWTFILPLPAGEITSARLIRFALKNSGKDLFRLVLTGMTHGLLTLVPALMLGLVTNYLLAGGNTTEPLFIVAMVLAVVGLLCVLVGVLQNTSMMRIASRSATQLEVAFWDRLLRLPLSVLHRQPSGDLTMAGMAFQSIRDEIQRVVANAILVFVFLLVVLGILFYYDVVLGAVVLGFSVLAMTIMIFWGMCQIAPHRRMMAAVRRVTGLLFEIIEGITKLRVENAESSAFSMWAQEYQQQKKAEMILRKYERHAQALGVALPFFAGGVLILLVALRADEYLLVGDFLIVFSVFIAFQYAIARCGNSFSVIASTMPALKQMQFLLAAGPDSTATGEPVKSLQGDVLFDRISFRYSADGPLILDDVTIHARPGEFIAIAGESGAGKSTLFRLALGLDEPTHGAVYYDSRDLRHLNLKQVYRQMGVVPQSVRLHPSDIWDNIAVHHEEPSTEQVWHAARAASIEHQIKAMPMGMMTMVGTSGSVLAGGESQRISIARSLLGNPRIILFDEATNWLDNNKQAEVMQHLGMLTSTRIVIAHRLSTLKQADRIYVLHAGKVVQSGTFDDLMETEGEFKELVRRQIA